jgi:lipopolysaccharide transport protein LptA
MTRNAHLFLAILAFGVIGTSKLYADLSDDVDEVSPKIPAKETPLNKGKEGKDVSNPPSPPATPKKDSAAGGLEKNNLGKSRAASGSSHPPKKTKSQNQTRNQNRSPVRFTSVGARGNRDLGVIELDKDVRVFQDDFSLTSDRARIFLNKETNEVQKVLAIGSVVIEKDDPNTGQRVRATGEEAEFLEPEQKVTLRGSATLVRGKDVMKGRIIVYEMKTGWVSAQKVDGVVSPQDN